ncbi:T9SS type A sorting domain-containing protein [bacterium]|nr:T9SS type A sorting domain-containing protein [bacterium]
MKKSLIIILILLCATIFSADSFQNGRTNLEVTNANENNTVFIFESNQPAFSSLMTDQGEFIDIQFENAFKGGEIGSPELPIFRTMVQIPFGSTPRIEVIEFNFEEINLIDLGYTLPVTPRRSPRIKISGYEPPFEINEEIYSRDSYQYRNPVEIIDVATARSYRLALIEIRPVDYNPVRGTIKVAKGLSFKVIHDNGDIALTRDIKTRYASKSYDALIKPLIANPEAFMGIGKWLPASSDLGYLIVTADSYADTSQVLAKWKARKGYSVKVKTVSELGGTANSIRNWILAEYDTSEVAPTYILLIGDIDDVPSFEGAESESETDTPYGDMDSGGYIPELFVGRISPADAEQLGVFVRRTIAYEQFDIPAGHRDFAHKAVFMASNDGSYWDLAEETQRYVISEHFSPAGLECDSIWAYSDPSASANSIAAVRDGRTILSYTGHGGYYLWDAPSWSQDDVRELGNVDEYPFVISNACITGTFSLNECFGETWIRQEDAGAIGFIGASNNSYWDEDDVMERVMFDDVFRADYRFAGGMLNRGLLGVHLAYPSTAEYYYDEYNLLGDPALAIWYGDPVEIAATYPPMLYVGGIVAVNVTSAGAPVDSALVCATDAGIVHSVGYTNSSGNVSLSVAGAGMGDTIWVTVTHYDMIPHLGYAIIGGGGAWLALDSVIIDDSMGDNDGLADIGEEIGFTAFIRNIGGEDANSVVGAFRTTESGIVISDSIKSFGNIVEGGTAFNASPFIAEFPADIPDGERITFNLMTSDEHDSSWSIPIGVDIHAPIPSVIDHHITDTLGGDGNNFFEPGETAELSITALNNGGETARYMIVGLAVETNPYVTVTSATSGIDSMVPGESKVNFPSFVLSASSTCPNPYMVEAYVSVQDFRGPMVIDTIVLAIGTAGFVTDCESGPSGWIADAIWHIEDHRFASPGNSWYCGVDNRFMYRDSVDAVLVSPEVAAPVNTMLSFWHYFDTEARYDSCYVHYSTDGGSSWHLISGFDGPGNRWKFSKFDLSSELTPGAPVRIKFTMSSDVYCRGEGWYIDDIELGSAKAVYLGAGSVEPFAGNATSDFRFTVICAALGGGIPSAARVLINGVGHNMAIADGSISGGATFDYTSDLAVDEYSYHYEFYFGLDTVRFPQDGEIEGPYVSDAFYAFDVGSSTAGIIHHGFRDDWEYGVPTSGPESVPIGTKCFATKLAGEYSDSSQSRLELPPINLEDMDNAYLCFYHWYRFQSSESYSFHDGGNIKIAIDGGPDTFVVHPQNGYDGVSSQYNRLISWENCFGGSNIGNFWQFEAIDLTPWIGHTVTACFDFGSSSRNTEVGWYVNNLYIYGIGTHGIGESAISLPEILKISAHPNPFNAVVEFKLGSPSKGAKLGIFDVNGRRVADLSTKLKTGESTVRWIPQDIPSGLYFARFDNSRGSITKPIILLK